MKQVVESIAKEINNMGGRIKAVPVNILPFVREQLEKADISNELLRDYFDFSFDADIKSLFIIALPSPPCYIEIEGSFGMTEADIPPVYIHRDQQLSMIKETVRSVFEAYHLKSWPVVLPKKILAAICGFGKYGRNNLLYIEGMGSCHRLTVFGTDMICPDEIGPVSDLRMERCSNCGVCMKHCQTGAIDKDNIHIAYDRCLTLHNESTNPIPGWIHKDWHNCLIGCMKCQEKCPANAGSWKRIKVGKLSQDEIVMLIESRSFDTLDTTLQNKLSELNMDRYYDVLSRNIELLLKSKGLI